VLCVVALSAACGGEASFQEAAGPGNPPPTAVATATPSPEDRMAVAESRYLRGMSPALADSIRSQPWFTSLTPEHLSLIGAVLAAERAAGPRGEKESVAAAFAFATQQAWYADGLDAGEAAGLRGVFETYAASLEDWRAPQVGPVLASTIQHGLTAVVGLPESGRVVVLVSAEDAGLGRTALDLAV